MKMITMLANIDNASTNAPKQGVLTVESSTVDAKRSSPKDTVARAYVTMGNVQVSWIFGNEGRQNYVAE